MRGNNGKTNDGGHVTSENQSRDSGIICKKAENKQITKSLTFHLICEKEHAGPNATIKILNL